MKFSTAWLLLFVTQLSIVSGLSGFPKIRWVEPKPEEKGDRFIYKAAQTVRLKCTDGQKWDTVSVVKSNPVLPLVHVRYTPSGGAPVVTLTLQYNASQFVDVVKVKCKRNMLDDTVLIEQQYPTANVNITSTNVTVIAGSKVKLTCLADGNPKPEYQWYNRSSKTVVVPVKGGNKATFEITTPREMSGYSLYQCRSRNSLNKPGQWVNSSSWMNVTSKYIRAIITSVTPPIASETSPPKLTYQELNVSLTCSVAAADSEDISMKVKTEMVTGNPVLPQVRPKFNVVDGTMPAQIQIQYDKDQFVPLVRVTCQAQNRKTGVIQSTLDQLIEQQYKTMHVQVQGLVKSVSPGDKVALTCVGDGNPEPNQYQWYNHTKPLTAEKTIELTAPTGWPSQSVLACEAKNKHNSAMVKSSSITVTSVTPPRMKVTPAPAESTANKFVYKEVPIVNVTCSLPLILDDVELDMAPVEVVLNPTGNGELPTYTHHNNNTLLEIEYPSEVFLALINVTCYARDRVTRRDITSSKIQIEQVYKTMNARIKGNNHKVVEPGQEMTLFCLADGNPPADEYQWYNTTTGSNVTLQDQTEASMKFSAPTAWSGRSVIVCEAKNNLRKDFVRTDPVTVTSVFVPKPVFTSIPAPSKDSTADSFLFMEEATINLTCSFATSPKPAGLELQLIYKQVGNNPLDPSEEVKFIQNGTRLEIRYNPKRFVSLINVTCNVKEKSTGMFKQASRIQINQQYKTTQVQIRSQGDTEVDPGHERTLECVGDGNPQPQEFEWYNRTAGGEVAMKEKTRFLRWVAPTNRSSHIILVCGTKNKYNNGIVKSTAVTVSSVVVPPPTVVGTPAPSSVTPTKLTYLRAPKVTLKCSFPTSMPKDVDLKISAQQDTPGNPVFTEEKVKFEESGEHQDVQLEITYNPDKFVPLVTVTCKAESLERFKMNASTVIQIEQQYKTNTVLITDPSGAKTVAVGSKVDLKCLADGNPPPTYQWFNRTQTGDVPLPDAANTSYQLTVPGDWSSQSVIVCGAANNHNNDTLVKSKPMTVSANVSPQSTKAALIATVTPSPGSAGVISYSWVLLMTVTLIGLAKNGLD